MQLNPLPPMVNTYYKYPTEVLSPISYQIKVLEFLANYNNYDTGLEDTTYADLVKELVNNAFPNTKTDIENKTGKEIR